MPDTLRDVLRLVRDDIDPVLVADVYARRIEALTRHLPVAPLAGFECRLYPAEAAVDFQVGFAHHGRVALEYAAKNLGLTGLGTFCEAWSRPALQRAIQEVWLEFDDCLVDAPPCVFFVLDVERAGREAVGLALDTMGLDASLRRNALECFNACVGIQRVAHVGCMLSRAGPAHVRMNVKRIQPSECVAFFQRAGLEAPVRLPERAIHALGFERYVLCIDHPPVARTVSLECGLHGTGDETAWSAILANLEEAGLCPPSRNRSLARWPGLVRPQEGAEWPATLISACMLADGDTPGRLERQISHFKLLCSEDEIRAVKAYFGVSFRVG